MSMRPSTLFAATLLASCLASPLVQAASARGEIDALLSRLESSGCEFNRNGSWHSGPEAKSHLLRKLEYLEKKNMAASAEQFIDLGASASSSSGKAYQVRCPGEAAVPSRQWLIAELQKLRVTLPR